MGIEKFKECQFFEHDVTEENRDYLVPCPPQDKCCFTLREHMTLDFWGREYLSSHHHKPSALHLFFHSQIRLLQKCLLEAVVPNLIKQSIIWCPHHRHP